MYRLFFFTVAILFLPISAQASVIINEIAWMGGVGSANHEWIELYNSGNEEVLVDGWTLDDGLNLSISLMGSIPAFSYAVLERSSEESSPASALLIYTGALVNTGATLTLKNTNGEIMDQVAGGENWQDVGGDNTNKDTAQYTAKGWVTDTPTPKAQNKNGRVEPIIFEEKTETKSVTKNTTTGKIFVPEKKTRSMSLITPNTILKMTADMQDVTYVSQTIPFRVEAEGVGDTVIDSLVYTWNFGDSYTAVGKEVKHTYNYPGTYVITINAKYARYDETIRQEITVLPVTFSITQNEIGDIQVQNDSPYDVDMSGFVLRGDDEVIFPAKTIILPKSTITISKKRLGLNNQEKLVSLYDTKGNIVTSNFNKLFTEKVFFKEDNIFVGEEIENNNLPLITKNLPKSILENESVFFADLTKQALANEEILESDLDIRSTSTNLDIKTNQYRKDSDHNNTNNERWPYVVFVCLIILSLFGIYVSRR